MNGAFKQRMIENSILAVWWLLFGGAACWIVIGSVAYWVKKGWLPPDTSGWAQALGGFLAVGVAIALPYFQSRRLYEERERASNESKLSDCSAAKALVLHFRELIDRLSKHRNDLMLGLWGRKKAMLPSELREAANLVREVRITEFSSDMVFVVLGLREMAAFGEQAALELESVDAGFAKFETAREIRNRAKTEVQRLDEWLDWLTKYQESHR